MTRDVLDDAVRALRETTAAEAETGHRFTRARVMADLHQGRVSRRTRLAFVLPLAASFVAASAWGVSSGKAQIFFRDLGESIGIVAPAPPAPPPAASQSAPARRAAPRPAAPPPVIEAAPVAPPPEPAEEEAEPAKLQRPAPSASAPVPADPELDLYRTAHRAHFVERDTSAALRAWDAYLAENPSGRFVLEAKYNRALCLVRLGRNSEARAALSPFARGAFGGYREREAKELIERLPE